MYRLLLFALAIAPAFNLSAQTEEEQQAVKVPIQQLFDGMRAADSTAVREAFLPDAGMYTAVMGKDGKPVLRQGGLGGFVAQVGKSAPGALNEQLHGYDIEVDGLLATAWTPYTFYYEGKLSHCGTNAFQLFKTANGWKISHVTDTRQQEGCPEEQLPHKQQIDALLDTWHRAAATADAEGFFGKMTKDAVYLGTDATERWLRDELRQWAGFAFEREVAWAFHPKQRELYFSADGKTAWFEELLDTENMGLCRGSGVLSLTESGWKIRHYDLSVMLPNEKMPDFLEMMKRQ